MGLPCGSAAPSLAMGAVRVKYFIKSGFAKYLSKSMIIVSPRPLTPATGHLLPAHVSQNGALFFIAPAFFGLPRFAFAIHASSNGPKRVPKPLSGGIWVIFGRFWLHLGSFLAAPEPLKKQLKVYNSRQFSGFGPSREDLFSRVFHRPLLNTPFSASGRVFAPPWTPRALPGGPQGSPKWSQKKKKKFIAPSPSGNLNSPGQAYGLGGAQGEPRCHFLVDFGTIFAYFLCFLYCFLHVFPEVLPAFYRIFATLLKRSYPQIADNFVYTTMLKRS